MTVSNYAKKTEVTRATIYARIKRGELPFKIIDGITFIYVKQ